ncbi:MAG: phenylalanyl-tRNA synthetase beta chain [Thermoplasmata archaeon]|nr:phenylalanyl-tRNA synthetase beta chain [Thermoplasmata archaeon]
MPMPVVSLSATQLRRLIGRDIPTAELAERMPALGGDVSGVEGDTIHMEWFPNRTDLLTLEGTGRALRAFLGVRPGLTTYKVEKPKTELKVDPSVASVRPYAGLCFVRNVPFDDAYVQSVIDAQEKLTLSPGRKRRKIAIGIHDAKGISGPFTYTCVGPKDKPFVALNETTAKTPEQIMATHPKGKEYAHLLPPNKFPVFLDSTGQVLSLPPVINAQRTAITSATRDVLIDVTGTDLPSVKSTIALLATGFAERGGTIEGVTVHDASGSWVAPDLKPSERVIHVDDVSALLGRAFTGDEAAKCLRLLGHDADAFDNKVHVKSPAWRFDLFHPVDLMEDVAIGWGYDKFPHDLPKAPHFGGKLPWQRLEDAARAALVGHGWHEAKTLTLSSPQAQWRNWGEQDGPAVQLLNPVLEDQTVLRAKLVPGLLGVLAANRHRNLPQSLFEAGYVVEPDGKGRWPNRLHLAGVHLAAKAGFSDAKGLVQSLLRDLKLDAKLAPGERKGLVAGRQGKVTKGGHEVGWFGELHPDTLVAFGLTAPCVVFEIDLAAFA